MATRAALKTPAQIEAMRAAGRVVREVLEAAGARIAPGVTTLELDAEARRICATRGAECLFEGVPNPGGGAPFPGAICASVNDAVVHGIPSDRPIREGDLVSIDFGARLAGWCADAAETFTVGRADPRHVRLVEVARQALAIAIERIRPGRMWREVAREMQACVEGAGFSVVRELCGHGIGREMWEPPGVPNYASSARRAGDFRLEEGMVIAVEPMVNLGAAAVWCDEDGWTIVTRDGLPSAHVEHTIAVTAGGADVLTA